MAVTIMALEITSEKVICPKCGMAFSKRKGYFPVSYAAMYKGSGYIPICKECIDNMYQNYLGQCNKAEYAVRQMCRKLDLYWSQDIFDYVSKKSSNRSIMSQYIVRTNAISNAGKCYDNTLMEEDSLWSFENNNDQVNACEEDEEIDTASISEAAEKKVTKKMIKFWGAAYSPEMILQLEERYRYWMSRLPEDSEIDIGTEVLLKQISALDIDINNCRVGDGKSLDKLINTQSNLLRDLNLKPVQRKKEDEGSLDDIPFGVGIGWCEKKRPITEPSDEFKDVDGIKKYILVWVYGHLVKMLGKNKNKNSRLYEEEIAKWRVERPEFDNEDDEDFIDDVLLSDEKCDDV